MTLAFLNPSRSYDPAQRRVRFVGHDGMFEIAFSVEVDVLSARGDGEAGCLAAFDRARDSILRVARKAYARKRKNIYVLTAADFA